MRGASSRWPRRHGATLVSTAKDMARLKGATGALARARRRHPRAADQAAFAEPDAERLAELVAGALKDFDA